MPERTFITLTDSTGALAVLAPELGGWLLRYARPVEPHGLVEALHFSQAIVDRYPREMYAGNPILFPLVGLNRVGDREHCYEWNGRVFELPQHGFGRRSKWTVIAQAADSVTMELTDTEATRAVYPFAFRHCVTYRLANGRLHWEQVVENRSTEPLPFGTGFHPYIRVPLTARSERAACFVEVPAARRMTPAERFEQFAGKPFLAQNWSVAADVVDTLYLADLQKAELALVDPVSELEVILNWADAPQHRYAALWSKATDAPFYCLEPWTSLPNAFTRHSRDHDLIVIEPQTTFRAAMWMEVRKMA